MHEPECHCPASPQHVGPVPLPVQGATIEEVKHADWLKKGSNDLGFYDNSYFYPKTAWAYAILARLGGTFVIRVGWPGSGNALVHCMLRNMS